MADLEILRNILHAIGSNHVRFDSGSAIGRTSNIFSRWFYRRCSQFCASYRRENRDICKSFLGLIKTDKRFDGLFHEAVDALNRTGYFQSGKPLSGRKAVQVIDALFKKRNPERLRQIEQYGADLLDHNSDRFIRNVIDGGVKPRGGLPYIDQQITAYMENKDYPFNNGEMVVFFGAEAFLLSLRSSVMNHLRRQYLCMEVPIPSDMLRSSTMRVLVERELDNAYFGVDAFRGKVIDGTYASVVRKFEALHLPVPSWDDFMRQLRKDIRHTAENWTSDHNSISTMQPNAYAERYTVCALNL